MVKQNKNAKPYSKNLREKLIEQIDGGMSITNASRIFRFDRTPESGLRKKRRK